jgi:dipeptidyl aminopeptidase/acylaminoacyl peptidase
VRWRAGLARALGAALAGAALAAAGVAPARADVPSRQQLIALPRLGSVAISPDGRHVAFTVRDTDWVGNAFVTQVWIAGAGEPARPLTRGKKSSTAPAWSPDGARIAFLSSRDDKPQVWALDMAGGDAEKLTTAAEGVQRFAWSPDGRRLAYTADEPADSARRSREQRLGDFEVMGEDHRPRRLWVLELGTNKPRALTPAVGVVGAFQWSPDGTRIAFDHQADETLGADSTSDIAVVDVAGGRVREIVTTRGPDHDPTWSPDGRSIAFESALGDPWYYYANRRIAIVPATGGRVRSVSDAVDEDANLLAWTPRGLWFWTLQRTASALWLWDPGTGRAVRHAPQEPFYGGPFSVAKDGGTIAYLAGDARSYPEVWITPAASMNPQRLTHFGDALRGWTLGEAGIVRWRSRDGALVEGVLRKPAGWRPGARRPLVVVIHGGPTGISRATLVGGTYVYPVERWLGRGALVLEPNYRGSAGYGAAFRALNVRNLGVGDAWDVMSGIDTLIAQGLVDRERVGVCGWSQGGYISAFLATHESRRFRAISVGAGISDWMTYYVNTDITPFTRQYLRATPWSDPGIYARTSPITTVRQATTPVLIQHGDGDRRVPAPNAFELWHALQDVGVPTRLVIYKGFGHGLDKPKAVLAAMQHNEEWFDRWLFPPRLRARDVARTPGEVVRADD